jgi:hypothetical protein
MSYMWGTQPSWYHDTRVCTLCFLEFGLVFTKHVCSFYCLYIIYIPPALSSSQLKLLSSHATSTTTLEPKVPLGVDWIILCGSSGGVTRLDGSDISCRLLIFVFQRFSSLLPLHPSLFLAFCIICTIGSFPTHHPYIYLRVSALEPVLCAYTMLRSSFYSLKSYA